MAISQSLYLADIIGSFDDLNSGKEAARWQIARVSAILFVLAVLSKNIKNVVNYFTWVTSLRIRATLTEMIYRKVRLESFLKEFHPYPKSYGLGSEVEQEWICENFNRTNSQPSIGRLDPHRRFHSNATLSGRQSRIASLCGGQSLGPIKLFYLLWASLFADRHSDPIVHRQNL